MHQIRFWLGLRSRPCAGRTHSAPPDPLLDLKGPTSKRMEREWRTWVRRRGGLFSLYLSIRGLRKGPGKFLMGVLESPGKVLDFFSVKESECALVRELVQFKTWSEAKTFCRGNASRSLPTLVDKASAELFQTVQQRLPSGMHLCMTWLGLHASVLSAKVTWRWMNNNKGK